MSWRMITRKDIGDLRRNRQLQGNLLLFVLVFGLFGYFHARSFRPGITDPIELVGVLHVFSVVLVPAVALMLSYDAIVRRRNDGQLTLLLTLAHHRRDVVVGTYLGRFVIVGTVLVAGVVTAVLVVAFNGVTVPFAGLFAFLVTTTALALAYVAIGVGISAGIRGPTWAAIAAFGAFLLFVLAWRFVPDGLAYVVHGFSSPASPPWWHSYVATLSPSVAYEELLGTALDAIEGDDANASGGGTGGVYAGVVLVGWALLAPIVGYLQFDRTDL